jgi:phage terminase large subunit-like protein
VIDYVPTKGNDKYSRVNAVAPLWESGTIWYPHGEKWAEEVIEECAAFPHGSHDDYVDTATQAMLRYRQGGLINTYSDYKDEERPPKEYVYYEQP